MASSSAPPATRQDTHWQSRLADLVEFHRQHGHSNVPAEFKTDPSLGAWVKQQRRRHRRGQLPEHRRQQLEQLGFDWNPKEELDVIWDEQFARLAAFHATHGHADVPVDWQPDRSLGMWVKRQRRCHRKGSLPPERTARLESLGFQWNPMDAHREQRIAQLAEFRRIHGHSDVPVDWQPDPSLGAWLKKQRAIARAGRLPMALRERLNALDVRWAPKLVDADLWELRFAELVKFHVAHGHCRVPKGWPPSPRLASWVKSQRREARRGTLSADLKNRLDDLGFDWNPKDELTTIWEQRFAQLADFHRQHGHPNVPTTSKTHPSLGKWVKTQRKNRHNGTLSPERAARLESLGIHWSPRDAFETIWDENFAQLADFHRQHGHPNVPTTSKTHPALGRWLKTQRKNRHDGILSPERAARLESLGIHWSPRDEFVTVWEERFAQLADFRRQHGHCRISTTSKTHPALGQWLKVQRMQWHDGTLPPERVARLESLGILWKPRMLLDAKWEMRLAELAAFHQQHGHFCPQKSRDPALWKWIRSQREQRQQGRLSPARAVKLETLGFPWVP